MRSLFLRPRHHKMEHGRTVYEKQPNVGAIHELSPTLESGFQVPVRKP
jgi:hypothetical protein